MPSATECTSPYTCLAADADGFIGHDNTSHASVRNASTGTTANSTLSQNVRAVMYMHAKGVYNITRTFIVFPTNGISTTVTAANLYIRGLTKNSGDVIAVKSTWNGKSTLATSNFDSLDFSTPYSSEVSTWLTSTSQNEIELNAQARLDMQNNDYISIALINHTYDYSDTDGSGATEENGMYYTEQSGTSSDPELGYTIAAAATPITLSAGVVTLSSGLVTIT
tara:strand:+ start:2026 stop:2694 length:669 start_codon:yes stop_codon:yes gene_type:complete